MLRRTYAVFLLGLLAIVASWSSQPACLAQQATHLTAARRPLRVTAVIAPEGALIAFPGGREVTTKPQFDAVVNSLPLDRQRTPVIEMDLVIVRQAAQPMLVGPGLMLPAWEYARSVSHYYVRVSWEKHYLACFERDVWHLGFMISDKNTGRLVVNLHLGSWWDGGPQFGAYNSGGRKFCLRTRINYGAVRGAIYMAAVDDGIGAAEASVIADVAAPVAFTALAL